MNLVGGDDGYGLRCVQFMWVPFVLLEFRRISSGRGYVLHLKDSWDESRIHMVEHNRLLTNCSLNDVQNLYVLDGQQFEI